MEYKTDSNLSELLSDPLVVAVMRCDGVRRDDLETLFERLRQSRSPSEDIVLV